MNKKPGAWNALGAGMVALAAALVIAGCDSRGTDADPDSSPLIVDTLTVEADATVASDLPGFALGESEELAVGTVSYAGGQTIVRRILLALPPLPLPLDSIRLSSATLVLSHVDSLSTLQSTVTLHVVDSAWVESTVTWYSQPPVDSTAVQTDSVVNGLLRFNVFPLYLDTTLKLGIMLKSEAVDIPLRARESAEVGRRPRVEVMYQRR